MTKPKYPTEITDNETTLGFQLRDIQNPDGHYAFSPSTVKAVVHELDQSNRIIKATDPNGTMFYKHQIYGVWPFEPDAEPDWKPYGDTFDFTPEEAIAKAKARVQDTSTCPVVPRIPDDDESNK